MYCLLGFLSTSVYTRGLDEEKARPIFLALLGYQSFHYSTCISRNYISVQWDCLDEASAHVQALQSTNQRFTWSIIVYHQWYLNGTSTREENPDCRNIPMYRRQLYIHVSGLGEALTECSIGQTPLGPVTSCSLTSQIIVKSNEGRFPWVQTKIASGNLNFSQPWCQAVEYAWTYHPPTRMCKGRRVGIMKSTLKGGVC